MAITIRKVAFVLASIALILGGTLGLIGLNGYFENARREHQQQKIDTILCSITTDRYTYDLVKEFADPFNETELNRLMCNFRIDYGLTFRSLAAGKYLKDYVSTFKNPDVGSLIVINDVVDFVLKHRVMNNGMDDPSGFASLLDLIKLMHYRNSPGSVQLENDTMIMRRDLTKMFVNATMAWADDSRLVLPTIGDTVTQIEVNGTRGKIYPVVAYAPYSQNVCSDPRYSYYPIDERGNGGRTANGTLFGIWGESFSRYVEQGHSDQEARILANKDLYSIASEWIKTIEFVPTRAEEDLKLLSMGFLNATEYRPYYDLEERQYDVEQGDLFLISHGARVDKVPIDLRPFTYVEMGLERIYSAKGIIDGVIYGVKDTAFRHLREELVPDQENIQFYACGVQYVVSGSDDYDIVAANPENFGIVRVDDSAKINQKYWFSKYPNRSGFEYFADGGNLIAVGEPVMVPLNYPPFVDFKKTKEFWDNFSSGGYKYNIQAKCFLFLPHMLDEGKPWYKAFDNTR